MDLTFLIATAGVITLSLAAAAAMHVAATLKLNDDTPARHP